MTKLGKRKVDCWSDKNSLKPFEVSIGSREKFLFDCDVCNHTFSNHPNHITSSGGWCPFCCSQGPRLCENEDCKYCLSRSFYSFDETTKLGKRKVDCWSSKNKFPPWKIPKFSSKIKAWFVCDHCQHEWCQRIASVTTQNAWCPYCTKHSAKLCYDDGCQLCFDKSFASFTELAPCGKRKVDCWSLLNKTTPRQTTMASAKKIIFDCPTCFGTWSTVLYSIKRGTWCPHCINKTELKVSTWLTEKYGLKNVKQEWKPKWCSTSFVYYKRGKLIQGKSQYRFDFAIHNHKIIVEVDGIQHTSDKHNYFKSTALCNQIRDKYKERLAQKHGYRVLRLFQPDVWEDRIDWRKQIEDFAEKGIVEQ